MPDYKKMYTLLSVAVSAALDMLPDTKENARALVLLQAALMEAEKLCAEADDSSER